ncbi:MAG: hypothetical protein ACR2N5_01210 [Solirubrobacterales bacterium]
MSSEGGEQQPLDEEGVSPNGSGKRPRADEDPGLDRSEDEPSDDEEVEFQTFVTNEFTSVRVRKIQTRNGERLEIESRRLPHSIRLDALVLESLTWRSVLELGEGLETPFGPELGGGAEDGDQ